MLVSHRELRLPQDSVHQTRSALLHPGAEKTHTFKAMCFRKGLYNVSHAPISREKSTLKGVKTPLHTFSQSSDAVWEHWEAAFCSQSGRLSWRKTGLRAKQLAGKMGQRHVAETRGRGSAPRQQCEVRHTCERAMTCVQTVEGRQDNGEAEVRVMDGPEKMCWDRAVPVGPSLGR